VTEDQNEEFLEEVSKKKIMVVLTYFKKEKSPSIDGWIIEFFLGFYEMPGEDLPRVIEEVKGTSRMIESF
jgi:hypothetical protein